MALNESMEEIRQLVQLQRDKEGINLQRLSQESGVEISTIIKLESEPDFYPTLKELDKICKVLKIQFEISFGA